MRNLRHFWTLFSLLCILTIFVGCDDYPEFHYNARDTTDGDLGDVLTTEELLQIEKRLNNYSLGKTEFVDFRQNDTPKEKLSRAKKLLAELEDDSADESYYKSITAYSDDVLAITSLEPRYTKLVFCVQAYLKPLKDVTITLQFDTGDEVSCELIYVLCGVSTQCIVSMPEKATKVCVKDISFKSCDLQISERLVFNEDLTKQFRRESNNTLRYKCKDTLLIVMNSSMVVTDVVRLNGKGLKTVCFGPKYFYVVKGSD